MPACNPSLCPVLESGSYYYTNAQILGSSTCLNLNGSCNWNTSSNECYYHTRCSTRSEADSIACLNSGNLWINGGCCDKQCVCQNSGGNWNSSTNTCEAPCNEHTNPQKNVKCYGIGDM